MKPFATIPVLLALTVAGCGDINILGVGSRDYEGHYNLAGTVDQASGDAVLGTITITRQRGDHALVVLDWSYLDRGTEILRITTDQPASAELGPDGLIYFEFEGDMFTSGRVVSFRLIHDGRLRGRTMTGYWRLTTGLPTDDEGGFTASRSR